jgi:type VI secretion system protein
MSLVLQLDSTDPAVRGTAQRRIEVKQKLTIGRGSSNDLVLPDPDRVVSTNHCMILFDGRGYAVVDTRSKNGTFLNNSPERLPADVPMPLAEGNSVRVGNYELTVTAIAPPGAGAGNAAPVRPQGPAHDDELFGDPFSDPFAGPPGVGHHRQPAPPPAAPQPHGDDDIFGPSPGAGAGSVIPDDVELFGDPKPDASWQGASHSDHAPSDQAYFVPPKVQVESIPDDWDLSDLGVAPGQVPPAARSVSPQAAFAEAEDAAPRRPALAMPRPQPLAGGGDEDAAIASFLAAVGLGGTTLTAAEKTALMTLAGEALVATVRGLTEILAARSTTKQEFRIERTMIGAKNNNPLKFSASLDEAMRVMLLGRVPGFLTAKQAIEEGLRDVKSHQLAVLAGMQVALGTVIGRFDPAKLEQRIEKSSLIEGILPGARKARYWELFKALYKEIAHELEDDFQSVFGAEFARAYKEQIEKL